MSVSFHSVSMNPPNPASPPPMSHVEVTTRSVGMPVIRARSSLSAIARMALPSFVRWSRRWTPSMSPTETTSRVTSWALIRRLPSTSGMRTEGLPATETRPRLLLSNTSTMRYRSANATPMLVMSSGMPPSSRRGRNTMRSMASASAAVASPETRRPAKMASGVETTPRLSCGPVTALPTPTSTRTTASCRPNPLRR